MTNVTVVLITTRVRELPTEVELGAAHGLIEGSVANCDNVLTVSKTAVAGLRGTLGQPRCAHWTRRFAWPSRSTSWLDAAGLVVAGIGDSLALPRVSASSSSGV